MGERGDAEGDGSEEEADERRQEQRAEAVESAAARIQSGERNAHELKKSVKMLVYRGFV